MIERDDDIHLQLKAEDEEYRRLCEKHSAFEKRLETLQEKYFLSEEEKVEEKNIKKQKLLLKDRMEDIRREHRQRLASQPAR